MDFTIRNARIEDAGAIGAMIKEFQVYLSALGDTTDFNFNAEAYAKEGFGPSPAFSGFVAEGEEEVIGYLLYHFGYDTDLAQRLVFVIDLYVKKTWRQHGIGRALMQSVTEAGRAHGAKNLIWSVYKPNLQAINFYKNLGARTIDLEFMEMDID
jgi:ribosomal protein S18 acetylase RimI-like enzyme